LGYSKEQFAEKAIWEIGLFKDVIANMDKFKELQQKEFIRHDNLPLETIDRKK
jgi:two-component system CheB/CheR fusion protein